MSVDETKLHNTILGILLLSKEQGSNSLLTTVLIKYLYLLDLFDAEEKSGEKTWTGLIWKFYHFGPYSAEIQPNIDKLVLKGIISKTIVKRDDDIEPILYSLSEYYTPKSLKDIGLSGYVTSRLNPIVRKYSNNLPSLLNYVYFNTLPMEEANPNDELDFSQCRKLDLDSFKPIKLTKLPKKKVEEARKKIRALISQTKQHVQPAHLQPASDSLSYKIDNDFSLPVGISGKISIKKD